MPFKYEINGELVEFDREPTEVDIDEAAIQLQQEQQLQNKQEQQPQQLQQDIFTTAQFPEISQPKKRQPSPLAWWQRGIYATGNDKGRRAYLEDTFPNRKVSKLPSGKFAVDGIPIDPEGFDFPGDIMDVSDELVRISGHTIGAAMGTLVAPGVGTIVGGGLGRATGQMGVEVIGRAFGMQQEEIGQLVKDIAMEGTIGAVGESFGLGLRAISKPTVKFLRNFIQRMGQKFGKPFEQTLVNFTSGAERYNVQRLQERGVYNIMTKENLSDDALLKVGEQIQTAAIEARKGLGAAVETGKGIVRNMHKANIDITDLRDAFGKQLQALNLLDNKFKPITPDIGKLDTGQKALISIFNLLKKHTKISPSKTFQWRNELDRIIKFNQAGKMVTTDAENALAQGLRAGLKEKLIQVSPEFAQANANFSAFAKIEEALKGKLNLQTVENFLKGLFTGQHYFERNLVELSRYTKINFMPLVRDVVAARDFASATFRGIRSGIFQRMVQNLAALGGVGYLAGGPVGGLAGLGAGIAVSTPRAAAWAIGKRQASVALLEKFLAQGGRTALGISPKFLATLLSRSRQKK